MMSARWKGAFISQKQLNRKIKQVENGRKRRKITAKEENNNSSKIDGSRIIDIEVMQDNMRCRDCNECLSLEYIEEEKRFGLASVFIIRCHTCLLLNEVPSSKKRRNEEGDFMWDVNVKAALGCGFTHLTKQLRTMDIPSMGPNCFKRYERIVGRKIEECAKESCAEAAAVERHLTIKNLDSIETLFIMIFLLVFAFLSFQLT